MAKLNRRSISRRTVEALKVEKDTVFWDRDLPGFGIRVYTSGTKMYVVQSRTKGKSVRVTVGRHGVISADELRRRGGADRQPDQGGRGPDTGTAAGPARGRADGGRLGGALHGEACRGALQAVHGGRHPGAARQVHLAGVRQTPAARGGARAGGGVPRPAERGSLRGEPGGGADVAHVCDGRGLGDGPRRRQPLPVGAQVPGVRARAVPDRHRVPPPRRGSRRGPHRGRGVGPCRGGDSAADADRLPQERDPVPAMD